MKTIFVNGPIKLSLKQSACAIGIFDGVHGGHQYLLKKMLSTAHRRGLESLVITFFPHPAHVMRPDIQLGYISSLQDRLLLLENLGIDICLVMAFNKRFAGIQPEAFIKNVLVKKLGVKDIFVGEDFRFGKDRSGDVHLFKDLAHECGYQMHAVPALQKSGQVISSTRIRQMIREGNLKAAKRLLGRDVAVSGRVVKGAQRGRSLGYPTANIDYGNSPAPYPSHKARGIIYILPPKGVYVVEVLLNGKKYPAVANLGTRPSFEAQDKVFLEVHLLDFTGNLYGKSLQVLFLKKIRDEKKFASPQELIGQIRKDEALARRYHGKI